MNKLYLSLILLFNFCNGSFSQQPVWVWQNPLPTGNDLNTVYFINSSTGFTGGNSGTLLRTGDGGANWSAINTGISDDIKSIYFTDVNTGYIGAGRFQCLILKTTNGGLNWTSQNLNLSYGARSINFSNANTGVATYNTGSILKTTNAGGNWISLTTSISYVVSAWMTSPTTIFAAGSSGISKSTDGGNNWISQGSNTGDMLSVCFNDSLNGIICGRQGLILRTTNGGTNWVTIPGIPSYDLNSVIYINSSTVVISAQGGAVLRSTNAGVNWTFTIHPESYFNNLNSIQALNIIEIFSVGSNGTIIKSANGGTNWTSLFSSINNEIYYSYFTDDNNGYAASFNAVIKTTNGGTNWIKLNSVNTGGQLYFRNPNTGFLAAMNSGSLYKTTNGGLNFNPVITGYPSSFRALSFINDNTGFIVTSSAKTLKTTNAGINWVQIDSTENAYYADLVFTDSLTGYISGMKTSPNASLIKKTTNGGAAWVEQVLNSTLGITTLSFVNNNTGFAGSNNNGQNFFKTTNGGVNWIAGTAVSPYINDLNFVNANVGYACGLFGNFHRTTNGGTNWVQLNVPSQNGINSIYHNNNTGVTYVLGGGGMILKSTNGSVTGFEQTGNIVARNYFLEQNYPNPFNPNTKIVVQLPKEGYVKLTVFDITGKEISVLMDGILKQGEYNIEFNGGAFSSGIYFYRLQAEGFFSTRKMILIK